MNDKRKLKLKKFYFHPITIFIFLTIVVVLLSGILSAFEMQATYNTVNVNTKELEPTLIAVENLFSFNGLKFILSNALLNFLKFAPLGFLLISMIGIAVAEASGLIEVFSKKYLSQIPKYVLTFLILLLATTSSIIVDIGYALLIPLTALVYFIIGRNPMLGIITAFCGVAFGTGATLFIGTAEISLMDYTAVAAELIDETSHIALSSNLFFIIASTFIISIIGTIIIEKIIAPKVGKYKREEELAKTEQYSTTAIVEEEQKRIEQDRNEKKGLRTALIIAIIYGLIVVYSLIPGLPGSGLLLDMKEKIYLTQIFGPKAYLKNAFPYVVSLFFILTGLGYGISSKTIKNDKELIKKIGDIFAKVGAVFVLIFVAAQFIAIFKETNIGIVITAWLANILSYVDISGIPLIIVTMLLIALSGIFLTSTANKWYLFSPVVVPIFMQSNISPQFAQIVMRAGDSLTKGFTPLMASFVLYIGFLNVYNLHKEKPYTIGKSMKLITPYFLYISIAWILIVVGWYILGLPIGPGVTPNI